MEPNAELILQRLPVAVICAQAHDGEVLARSIPLWPLLDDELDVRSREEMAAALGKAQELLSVSPELDAEGADAFAMPCDGRRVFFVACPAALPKDELLLALGRLPEQLMPSEVFGLGAGEALAVAQASIRSRSLASAPGVAEHWGRVDVAGYSAMRDHEAGKGLGQNVTAQFAKGDRLLEARRNKLREAAEIEAAIADPQTAAKAQAEALIQAQADALHLAAQSPRDQAARAVAEKLQAKRKYLAASGSLRKAPLMVVDFVTNYSSAGCASIMPMYWNQAAIFSLMDLLPGSWEDHCPRSDVSAQELVAKTKKALEVKLGLIAGEPSIQAMFPKSERFLDSLRADFANGRWVIHGDVETKSFHLNDTPGSPIKDNALAAARLLAKTPPVLMQVGEKGLRADDVDLIERLAAGESFERASEQSQWRGASAGFGAHAREREVQELVENSSATLALIGAMDLRLATPSTKSEASRPGL